MGNVKTKKLIDISDDKQLEHLQKIINDEPKLREWLNSDEISKHLDAKEIYPDYLYYCLLHLWTAGKLKNRIT